MDNFVWCKWGTLWISKPFMKCTTYIRIMGVKHQSTFRCAMSFPLKHLISLANALGSLKWGIYNGTVWFVHLTDWELVLIWHYEVLLFFFLGVCCGQLSAAILIIKQKCQTFPCPAFKWKICFFCLYSEIVHCISLGFGKTKQGIWKCTLSLWKL